MNPTFSRLQGLKKYNRHPRAFTLMEIMIVVLIIGLLVGLGATMIGDAFGIGQEVKAKADIKTLSTQLKMYKAMNGHYPSQSQGLEALVTQPTTPPLPRNWRQLMEQLPHDPWQREYIYEYPGKRNPRSFDLYTQGDNPEDSSSFIGNWSPRS